MGSATVRVAILHQQRTWGEALEHLLGRELGLTVPVAHTSIEWVLGAVLRGEVDVVLLSVAPGWDAPAMVERLRAARPQPRVVLIGDTPDPDALLAVLRAGARGWVRPTASAHELEEVVVGVAKGESWLPHDLDSMVLDRLLADETQRTEANDALSGLSPRELEILQCLAQGMSRAEIAEQFMLSPHTVRTHINHVLRKLGAHSTLAAVLVLRRAQLPAQRPAAD